MTPETIKALVRVLNDHNDGLTDALRYSINDLSGKLRDAGLISYSLSEGYSVKQPEAPVATDVPDVPVGYARMDEILSRHTK
jgi:hypothetical protein